MKTNVSPISRARSKPAFIVKEGAALKALSSPLRTKILRILSQPASISEVAAALGKPSDRLYYHFRLLERSGLIGAVGTRELDRTTERVYQASAERIELDPTLLGKPGSSLPGRTVLREALSRYDRALLQAESLEGVDSFIAERHGYMPAERLPELQEDLRKLLSHYFDGVQREDSLRVGAFAVVAPLASGKPPASDKASDKKGTQP